MRHLVNKWLLLILISFPASGFAQMDSLVKMPANLGRQNENDTVRQANSIYAEEYKQPSLSDPHTYIVLLGSNLKQEFTKPFHMAKKDWGNFGKFAAVTVALGFADEPVQQAALKLRNRNTDVNTVSKYVTNFGGLYEVLTLAGLGTYGLVFKNEKLKTTTLLATQSCITATALTSVLKILSGRTRPSYYHAGQEAEPKFLLPFSKASREFNSKRVSSSFPSGHTTFAFAAATVFASQYRDKPIVPIIAYSAATLVGASRITENKHWVTDVFVGAAVGFFSGKQVVNSYHHYSQIKNEGKKKYTYSFSLNYYYGHWEPGLLVHLK